MNVCHESCVYLVKPYSDIKMIRVLYFKKLHFEVAVVVLHKLRHECRRPCAMQFPLYPQFSPGNISVMEPPPNEENLEHRRPDEESCLDDASHDEVVVTV